MQKPDALRPSISKTNSMDGLLPVLLNREFSRKGDRDHPTAPPVPRAPAASRFCIAFRHVNF
jgi:hypothetical protein